MISQKVLLPDYLQGLTDEQFFELDHECYLDCDYDAIKYWNSLGPHPVVHAYDYEEQTGDWDTWARYCYEAACRDNPIALAKYA